MLSREAHMIAENFLEKMAELDSHLTGENNAIDDGVYFVACRFEKDSTTNEYRPVFE